jgi:glyoxylase-like metal-dependent hydrolase (beta-lactamase superfamily II)
MTQKTMKDKYEEPCIWHVGDVKITRIIELQVPILPPLFLFKELTTDQVQDTLWLPPHFATEEGMLSIAFQSFVIESRGRTIIVDTGIGNDKKRLSQTFDNLQTAFVDKLILAGYELDKIDMVVCTHLHADHVGWNTRWGGLRWMPTFPNAIYHFGRVEWEHWRSQIHSSASNTVYTTAAINDSVKPLVDAHRHRFVETNHKLTSEVYLIPTPGHTPGHVSVKISSGGQSAVITGDMIQHPVQFAMPELASIDDGDAEAAAKTRRAFMEEHAGSKTLVIGSHFAPPTAGYIVRDGKKWRFDFEVKEHAGPPKKELFAELAG